MTRLNGGLSLLAGIFAPILCAAESKAEPETNFTEEPLLVQTQTVPAAENRTDSITEEPRNDPEQEQPQWSGTVELYGFGPLRMSGDTKLNGRETDYDLNLDDVLSLLDGAFYVRGSLEANRWGLLTDLSYVKVGDENAITSPGRLLTGKAKVNFKQGIYDLAVRYRFGDREQAVGTGGDFSIIPYAGVRVLDLSSAVKVQIQGDGPLLGSRFVREGQFSRTWAQPLVGVQANYFVSPRLRLFARGDIAGFGISGDEDLSGNAQVGVGYAIGNSTDLTLSWRYLGIRYENDKQPSSGFTSNQNGVELGLKFFF